MSFSEVGQKGCGGNVELCRCIIALPKAAMPLVWPCREASKSWSVQWIQLTTVSRQRRNICLRRIIPHHFEWLYLVKA
jgi:hypothetical protein